MKITFFLFFLFFPVITFSQKILSSLNFSEIAVEHQNTKSSDIRTTNYFPLVTGDFWEYIENEGLLSSQTKEVLGDTLLSNGLTYKKVYSQYCANSVDPIPEIELLRKDSIGNVYSFLDGKDQLLYDFSKDVGDIISSPWQGYNWGITKKYKVIAFGEDTVKAMDMVLSDSLNQLSYFITFIENYGITFYSGERNRQAGDYVGAEYWGSIIDGFQRKELLVTKSKPDWKAYYPLDVGNKWIYRETYFAPIKDTLIIEVIKDTLFSDGKVYKKLLEQSLLYKNYTYMYYERLDSIGNVFRIDPFDGDYDGHPVLRFSMCVGDTIALYRNIDEYRLLEDKLKYFWDILNDYEYTLFYSDPYSLASEDQFFVKNIGLIKKNNEGVFDNLIGAYINGVVYGDTTITALKETVFNPSFINLSQNYPNPFNGVTKIKYNLDTQSVVSLIIYDLTGREVKRLINNRTNAIGGHEAVWNGKNNEGKEVSSGIYIYGLILDNTKMLSKKLLFLK